MNEKQPLVSIGMPVYNGENYIAEAIEAILKQTFTDIELIISDNASEDQTANICQEYAAKDPRVLYFRNETNVGAAKNYNITFHHARGKYFKWAAHDDLITPDMLKSCVDAMEADSGIVLCYPKSSLIDSEGHVKRYIEDGMDLRSAKPQERFAQFYRATEHNHPIFGLIRSDVLAKTSLIPSYYGSDRITLGELSLYGRFCEIPENMYFRRMHEGMMRKYKNGKRTFDIWFDPANLGRRWQQKWLFHLGYIKAINQAPLTFGQRIACYSIIVQNIVRRRVKKIGKRVQAILRPGISK